MTQAYGGKRGSDRALFDVAATVSGWILADGLLPKGGSHVHLSVDIATATTVGARRGEPIVLRVAAGAMHADGHAFYQAANGVWLTDHVAPASLTVMRPDPRLREDG